MTYASAPFDNLPRNGFGAIYADPPWKFEHWGKTTVCGRDPERHYSLLDDNGLAALPVQEIAADDCVLLMWATWPCLKRSIALLEAWGFTYKTCGFDWMKADVSTVNLFPDPVQVDMTLGYWTRSNSEPCLLGTRGQPQRVSKAVRMGIIEPRREHSRKPDCVYERIERLVAGPYVELFARTTRKGWSSWGNQVGKFAEVA